MKQDDKDTMAHKLGLQYTKEGGRGHEADYQYGDPEETIKNAEKADKENRE